MNTSITDRILISLMFGKYINNHYYDPNYACVSEDHLEIPYITKEVFNNCLYLFDLVFYQYGRDEIDNISEFGDKEGFTIKVTENNRVIISWESNNNNYGLSLYFRFVVLGDKIGIMWNTPELREGIAITKDNTATLQSKEIIEAMSSDDKNKLMESLIDSIHMVYSDFFLD